MSKTGQTVSHTNSRIFEGYRVLGKVSNNIPCLLRYIHRRRENFIITCIGKSFNTYASQKLKLLATSGTVEDEITSMASDTFHVYTAAKNIIYAWRRGNELQHKYQSCSSHEISLMLPFGQHLLAIDSSGELNIWNIKTEELIGNFNFNVKSFKPSAIMHPATYLNKVLIGSEQGSMKIYNIRTCKLVHHFEGWTSSIIQIIQAPAVDFVAIALSDKRVLIHNIKFDEAILELNCLQKPTSLAFRTDGPPILLVGSEGGSITSWDLENKEILSSQESAHLGSVTGLQFFPQEPLFVSSSADNSVKVWIFDMPDGSFRLLNSRDGHLKPCNKIKFHGQKGYNILSSSLDSSFRVFHIYNETCNYALKKYGVTHKEVKIQKDFTVPDTQYIPPIVDFTTECVARPKHYADIACCHQSTLGLTTWSFASSKFGSKLLIHPKYKNLPMPSLSATCLCLTTCGQFVIAGYSNGTVERFNIQSGIHRKSYNPPHLEAVRGIGVDSISNYIATGSGDSTIKIWNFTTGEILKTISLNAGVSFMFQSRKTSLVGVALDDFSILVFDIVSHFIVRRFTEMSDVIIAATFSPNSKWITASSGDCLIRTWNLPTAKMVDVFRLESIANSLDYSPNGEFLAMSLYDQLGILLWLNKTIFSHISLMPIPDDYEPPLIGVQESITIDDEMESEEEYKSPEQIGYDMITLSNLPESRWRNLLNIDLIRKRNKPKEAPKTYIAPFFLSAIANNMNENQDIPIEAPESKIVSVRSNNFLSNELSKEIKDLDFYENLMKTMEGYGPSQTEMELRLLGPLDGGSVDLLKEFIHFICEIVKTKKFYEASQAFLALFLKMHGVTIKERPDLCQEMENLSSHLEKRDNVLLNQFNMIMSYTSFLKSNLF